MRIERRNLTRVGIPDIKQYCGCKRVVLDMSEHIDPTPGSVVMKTSN